MTTYRVLAPSRAPSRPWALAAALAVAAPPFVFLLDAATRVASGWWPAGRAEAWAVGGLAIATLLPLGLAPVLHRSLLARRVVLVQAAATLALVALETTLRASVPVEDRAFPYPPGLHETFAAASSPAHSFSTNSAGLRGREPSGAEETRILVLGGGAAQCVAQDDEESWPALLEARLREATGRGCLVENAAKSGLATSDHVRFAERLPESARADLVLVFCGFDDAVRALRGEADRGSDAGAFWSDPDASAPALSRLALFSKARRAFRSSTVGSCAVPSPSSEDADVLRGRRLRASLPKWDESPDLSAFLETYRASLRRLAAAVRARGAEVVFVAQPTAYESIDPSPVDGILAFAPEPDATRVLSGAALRRVMDRVAGATVAEAEALGARWACLEGAVPRTAHLFRDDSRLTDAGCAWVADALAPVVERALAARPARTSP